MTKFNTPRWKNSNFFASSF